MRIEDEYLYCYLLSLVRSTLPEDNDVVYFEDNKDFYTKREMNQILYN